MHGDDDVCADDVTPEGRAPLPVVFGAVGVADGNMRGEPVGPGDLEAGDDGYGDCIRDSAVSAAFSYVFGEAFWRNRGRGVVFFVCCGGWYRSG